jgi:hypothetical protein
LVGCPGIGFEIEGHEQSSKSRLSWGEPRIRSLWSSRETLSMKIVARWGGKRTLRRTPSRTINIERQEDQSPIGRAFTVGIPYSWSAEFRVKHQIACFGTFHMVYIAAMLRNYAHHAQSPKSSVHSVHKMQGKVIWQTLKKLSCWSSFAEPCLQSHICEGHIDRSYFPWRTINAVYMIGMIGVDQLCARRTPIGGRIGARIGSIGPICARDCAWPCACTDRLSQFLRMHMCTHIQNGFADRHKQTACTLFHRYRWDAIPPRNFFYCCTSPQIPLHTAQKNGSHCHDPAA